MQRMLLLTIVLLGLGIAARGPNATAQPSNEETALLQVVEMRVHVVHAPIYVAPRRNAEVVRTLAWNEQVLVLAQTGKFYKVVHPEGGPQGYMLGAQLRPTSHPLHASDKPEDLRREERYVGARFDVHGGVAVPHQPRAFADGYRPGLDVGARFSYPVMGPVGVATRMSYRQFGEGDGTARPLRLSSVDIRGRALSTFAGAVGLDLTIFRGYWVAFVATVDGGVYHVAVDETVPAAKNPFGAASSVTWGGSASLRVSLRMGTAVRLFLEPGYEVIRTGSGDTHLLPARIGLSVER